MDAGSVAESLGLLLLGNGLLPLLFRHDDRCLPSCSESLPVGVRPVLVAPLDPERRVRPVGVRGDVARSFPRPGPDVGDELVGQQNAMVAYVVCEPLRPDPATIGEFARSHWVLTGGKPTPRNASVDAVLGSSVEILGDSQAEVRIEVAHEFLRRRVR